MPRGWLKIGRVMEEIQQVCTRLEQVQLVDPDEMVPFTNELGRLLKIHAAAKCDQRQTALIRSRRRSPPMRAPGHIAVTRGISAQIAAIVEPDRRLGAGRIPEEPAVCRRREQPPELPTRIRRAWFDFDSRWLSPYCRRAIPGVGRVSAALGQSLARRIRASRVE